MVRWVTLLGLAAPGLAWGTPSREALITLLSAYEDTVNQADLVALGEGVDAELLAIAADPEVPITRRGRAVTALQYYPSDGVRSYLESVLSPTNDPLLRRKAVGSLAAFGPSSVPVISAQLSDPDVQMRIAAAQALGVVADPTAKAALQAALNAESDPAARDELKRAVRSVR
jgi:HEAT repeats